MYGSLVSVISLGPGPLDRLPALSTFYLFVFSATYLFTRVLQTFASFSTLVRIQGSMSAQAFTLTASRSTVFSAAHMTDDDTKTISQGLSRRDPDLLDHLIEQYQHRLYRYLLFITSNPALAEDLFQETWIRVLERGHQYNAKCRFESWLFAIARNLVIDVSRRKKMASLEDLANPETEQAFDPPDDRAISALQLLVARENELAVQVSLQQIAPYYREVLLLRFHEELNLEEIAEILSTPVSTVKSRLYRGLTAMKAALSSALYTKGGAV
jgi:RNA polymerase sigma-70 factor (ECF subfamily)